MNKYNANINIHILNYSQTQYVLKHKGIIYNNTRKRNMHIIHVLGDMVIYVYSIMQTHIIFLRW